MIAGWRSSAPALSQRMMLLAAAPGRETFLSVSAAAAAAIVVLARRPAARGGASSGWLDCLRGACPSSCSTCRYRYVSKGARKK